LLQPRACAAGITDFRLTINDWHGRLESSSEPKTQAEALAGRLCRCSIDSRQSQIEKFKAAAPRASLPHSTQRQTIDSEADFDFSIHAIFPAI
jgi:hypothetical protein